MFRTPSTTDQAKDAVAAGAEKVTDGAQVAVDKAAELKVKAGEAATATAAGASVAKEKASDAAEVARETAETLADHDPPVLTATIGQRVAFATAAQSGRLVSELDDDTPAAREIAALADEIDRLRIGRTAR